MDQFSRIRLLIGEEKLKKIRHSRVAVLGLGAVGSYCLESLARSGVGHLMLVDFDTVKLSNINRQLLALHSTVGQKKVDVAKRRVGDIFPNAHVQTMACFADAKGMEDVLEFKPDLVIDAVDSLNPKVEVLRACHRAGVSVISSMGAASRRDPFCVRVDDISQTQGCPLATRVRKRLRKDGVHSGILCVYSREPRHHASCQAEPDEDLMVARGRPRRPIGSLPTMTALFGILMAHAALERLCGGFAKDALS